MRVVIPVFFRNPYGGLQENVRSQASGLRTRGFDPLVVCPDGAFSESLESEGIVVWRTDFADVESDARRLASLAEPNLVHFHPFASRELGLRLASMVGCPVIATFHGLYNDGIAGWITDVDQIVAVSNGVRDHLVSRVPSAAEKVLVVVNGVDTERFSYRGGGSASDHLSILVAGRFGRDTVVMVDMMLDTWSRQLADRRFDIHWRMAGDGTRLAELEALANRINSTAGDSVVTWHGWLEPESLAELHGHVGLSVAAGRSALESMASGLPTIVVGAKSYYGPTWKRQTDGMAWNWGHVNTRGYESGSLYRDLNDFLGLSTGQRERIGVASRGIVEAFHSQRDVDDRLTAIYRMHLADEHL